MVRQFCILVILCLSMGCQNTNSSAKDQAGIDLAAKEIIDPFIEALNHPKIDDPLLKLFQSNGRFTDSAIAELKQKFSLIQQQSGKFIEGKLVRKKKIGDDLAVYSYLIKYELKFYRFLFVFYNNSNVVKLYRFSFDDNIDIELEESLKFYVD